MMRTVVPATTTTVMARQKKQLVPQEIDKDVGFLKLNNKF